MASKKRSSKKVSKKVVKKAAKAGSKMELATKVYQDMTGRGLPRKAVIEAFMSDKVGLTKAGSSTYYQLISKKLA